MQTNSLTLESVSKFYGTERGVDKIDLLVRQGELFSLLGPSGSGKTTLLNLVAGFLTPDAGRVVIEGEDVTRASPQVRNIGVVFQNYSLFPHMSAFQNVCFPLRVRRLPRRERNARAMAALESVGLSGFGLRRVHELSGGQQQRVAIARAIVFEPRLLLLDEPMSALDKDLRAKLRLELKQLQRHLGVTMVYVTHDQEEALALSDRMALLCDGNLVQVDTPRQLYGEPVGAFSASFMGETSTGFGRVINAFPGSDRLGYSTVQLDDGATILARQTPLEDGTRVSIHIRSEDLKLSTQPGKFQNGTNIIPGTVIETIYMGRHTKYLVRSDGLGEVIAGDLCNDGTVEHGIGRGDQVNVAFSAGKTYLFPVNKPETASRGPNGLEVDSEAPPSPSKNQSTR